MIRSLMLVVVAAASTGGCGSSGPDVPDACQTSCPTPEGAWTYSPLTTPGVPYGGRVSNIMQSPTADKTFFISSTGAGLWRSRDAGATWEALLDAAAPSLTVGAFDLDRFAPDTIYVGLGDHYGPRATGVMRSTDAGATWS